MPATATVTLLAAVTATSPALTPMMLTPMVLLPDPDPGPLGVCGGPLQPVCDAAGGLAGSLGGGAAGLVLHGLGAAFVAAADQVTQAALAVLDATTSVELTAGWFRSNLALITVIALPVVVGLFVLQVIASVLRRDPGGLARAVIGIAKALLGAGLAVAVTASLLVAADQICEYLTAAAGTTVSDAAGKFVDLTWLAGPSAGPVLQMLVSLALMIGFLLLWAVMLFRKAALLLVVIFAPIAFAGSAFDHTRAWTRRWIEVVAALIACKIVIVVVFLVGASAFAGTNHNPAAGTSTVTGSDAASGSLSDTLAGGLLLAIAVLAPWLTYRFVHWSGVEAASIMHTTLAASPVPAAARSAAVTARATTTRAVSTALLGATTGGAGAAAAAAGGVGGTARAGSGGGGASGAPSRARQPSGSAAVGGARAGAAAGNGPTTRAASGPRYSAPDRSGPGGGQPGRAPGVGESPRRWR